jgi:hypothetical protein
LKRTSHVTIILEEMPEGKTRPGGKGGKR